MSKGIDLGNWNVKTSDGDIFPSRYSTTENLLGATGDVFEYQGQKYFMSEGNFENNYDKASKETNLILFLYALARCERTSFKVVVGLPVSSYKTNRERFKEQLLENKVHKVILNGLEKTLIIEELIVFPEGAGAYYTVKDRPKNAVVIDIGGGTTNIVSFKDGKLDKCTTLPKGMIELYNRIREHINSTYTLKLELEDIESVMREGLMVDGESINFKFLKVLIDEFTGQLMNEIRNYEIRTSKVFLVGGGSRLLKGALSKRIIGLQVIEDYLFANAKGFERVGISKWKD